MKQENRWAPVNTVSGKVDSDSPSTAPGGERVELAETPCAPGEPIARTLAVHAGQLYAQSITPVPGIRPGLPIVNLEEGELEYVASILIADAVQAMRQGGVLSVVVYEETVRAGAFALLRGAAIRPGCYVVLAVKDTGPGRVPELGAIEEVVAPRGGGIIWHAPPGHGTRVNVYLPVAP